MSGESNMLKMSVITSSSLTGSCLWVHVLGCNQTQQIQDVSTRTQTIFFPLFLGMFLRTFVSKWIHCKQLLLRRRVEDVGDEKETLRRFVQIQSEHQKSASLYGILSLFTSVIISLLLPLELPNFFSLMNLSFITCCDASTLHPPPGFTPRSCSISLHSTEPTEQIRKCQERRADRRRQSGDRKVIYAFFFKGALVCLWSH